MLNDRLFFDKSHLECFSVQSLLRSKRRADTILVERHPTKNIWLILLKHYDTNQMEVVIADYTVGPKPKILTKELSDCIRISFFSNQFILVSGIKSYLLDYSLKLYPDLEFESVPQKLCVSLDADLTSIVFASNATHSLHLINVGKGAPDEKQESKLSYAGNLHAIAALSKNTIAVCGTDTDGQFIREYTITENKLVPATTRSKIETDLNSEGHAAERVITCMDRLPDGRIAVFSEQQTSAECYPDYTLLYYKKNTENQQWILDFKKQHNFKMFNDVLHERGLYGREFVYQAANLFHKVPLPFILIKTTHAYYQQADEEAQKRNPSQDPQIKMGLFNLETGELISGSKAFKKDIEASSNAYFARNHHSFHFPSGESAFPHLSYITIRRNKTLEKELEKELEKVDELKNCPTPVLSIISSYCLFKTEELEKVDFEKGESEACARSKRASSRNHFSEHKFLH